MHESIKYGISIVLLLAFLQGCGIFDTRTPESPVTIRSTYVPPTTAELVLTNLVFAVTEKNTDNYVKCLSPSLFSYVPDSKSQLIYGTLFQFWSVSAERNYLSNIISVTNSNATSALFLDNPVITTISPDSVIYKADYIIVFQHNKASVPKSAIGNVTLTLRADESNLFYIDKWEDFRKHDTDFTWSELKANFSN